MTQTVDRLANFDITAHNAEVQQCLKAYRDGRPYRTPVILGLATRFFIYNSAVNPAGLSFREYSENPYKMFEFQLHWQRWQQFNVLQDTELGLPAKWVVYPDFQNYHEAAWFGCGVHYLGDQVPDTMPDFADAPERLLDRGLPDPFGGFSATVREYVEHFRARAQRETYLDRPISIGFPMCNTDGPFTVACNLFGPTFVCEAVAGEPERYHRLLDFITTATIQRMTAWRKYADMPVVQEGFFFADDSVALISTPMYIEHVLPYHRRILAALAAPQKRFIHLCGDATRHFKTLRDELNVQTFDTGYPVDFGALRRELGTQVRIQGGPPIEFLRTATPAAVRERVRQILQTGILDGGLFILREGNNMAPGTPLENMAALYQAGRDFGVLA